jgi:hypothetical protein
MAGKRGRQTKKAPDKCAEVVSRISAGEPLTVICADIGVCDDTVRNWADADPAFARDIARARLAGFDAIAFRLRDTARGAGESSGDVQRDKLIIDTDLKLLAKWDPKRYGERQHIEMSVKPAQELTDDELARIASGGGTAAPSRPALESD